MSTQPEWRQVERIVSAASESQSGCWVVSTWLNRQGYGLARFRGARMMAHRATYTYFRADIPEGLELDHLCRTRACINPWHLEPVTRRENALRSEPASRPKCIQGHPLSGENLWIRPNGWRVCRTCQRKSRRESAARRAAA